MPKGEAFVAFDLGAESGRAMLGALGGGRLELQEVHRFANRPVQVPSGLHWDVLRLWEELKDGLVRAKAQWGGELAGIGLDTWGVDFCLLDRQGELLGLPYHYRDRRTEGIIEELRRQVSEWELYVQTGLPYSFVNTLCQLAAMRRAGSPALDVAQDLLMISGLFTFWLCGERAIEATIAGTTQCFDLTTNDWCRALLGKLHLPSGPLRQVVPTATVLGTLQPSVAEEVGVGKVPVIFPACHDSAAAAAVVPTQEEHATFISSGTWSVVGTELRQPLLTPEAMAAQFFNEVGACGRIIFVQNSMGLWPIQECRREWLRQGHDWSYADLTAMAAQARPFAAIVNPDDPVFFPPGDMTARVAEYCRRTHQEAPSTPGSLVRALLEGLALRYRQGIEDLERLTRWPTRTIHILGGGSRNALLCQLTADATGRPVLAGPSEATATATVLLQALARGKLSSLAEVREVSARSCELLRYDPRPSPAWDEAYASFRRLSHS